MSKRFIITSLFALIALTITAQEKLIRVESESTAWRNKNRQVKMFDQEKARLLIPQNAEFGVECIPSFSPEWSLTYDSLTHALVYKEAMKSIWYTTYNAMYKKKTKTKKDRKITKRKLRKKPKDYIAPDINTYTLAITPEQHQMLWAIWKNAVGTAEDRIDGTLDGTTWMYFIDGKRAKTKRNKNVFVIFTNELQKAVKTDDSDLKDSLIYNEFQRVVSNLNIVLTRGDSGTQPNSNLSFCSFFTK